ncbi:phosphotransferase enzyme family protein [Nocardia sp. NPDC088792]|uniref:phosphotransferase enzyme family protein n=1 Tax=Nocardia sp. NPDC088792 TaxID=3364332 RepID=UPI0037F546D8
MTDGRVYGMGHDPLVEPDWPALTSAEIAAVAGADAVIEWRSPRPLSATARVMLPGGQPVIVKRLPHTLRDTAALGEEHRFMDHLRAGGIPIPRVVRTVDGGEFTYEVQEFGVGADRYEGVFSWSPYLTREDAAAAGRLLARLHLAAAGYAAPRRDPHPLLASFTIFSSANPLAAVAQRAVERPALGEFLARRDWRSDLERAQLPVHERLYPLLPDLEPLWTHNDWHGTNLLWHGDGVSSVIDFGLCDRTTAIHDVATAIERCAVDWISLRDGGPARVQLEQVRTLLAAYESLRPLTPAERRALPELLPLVHAEYELSEIDYFLSVIPGGNEKNAEIAYTEYFLGHTDWWRSSPEARPLLRLAGGE